MLYSAAYLKLLLFASYYVHAPYYAATGKYPLTQNNATVLEIQVLTLSSAQF